MTNIDINGYKYDSDSPAHTQAYLLPVVLKILNSLCPPGKGQRVFDLGCGNGSTVAELSRRGFTVVGVDPSEMGIRIAHEAYPELSIHVGSAYDNLAEIFGQFSAVISLEVVEHVYYPRKFASTVYSLLSPGGTAIISTPYHGYWKNLALAVTGRMDSHYTALWDHGHIKFWSARTLTQLLNEAGFQDVQILRVGRIPALAKSMIAIARRPA